MKYAYSDYWTLKAKEIAGRLGMEHINVDRVSVIESRGSKSKRTIARIHSIGKVMQLGMQQKSFYTIELISEKFYRQTRDEQMKTIIHELMHIPAGFGGGFRGHKHHVTHGNVEQAFQKLCAEK